MSTLHLNSLYPTSILHHCFSPFIHISFRHPSRSPPVLNSKFVCIHRSVQESLPARPRPPRAQFDLGSVRRLADCGRGRSVLRRKHGVSKKSLLKKKQGKKNHNPFASTPLRSALISPVLLRRCAVINGNAALPQGLPLLCISPVVY